MSNPKRWTDLETDTGAVVSLDVGHGPIVVLSHGLASATSYWSRLIECLPDVRFIAVDLNKIPLTSTDGFELRVRALIEVVVEIDEPVVLFGHSLGGAISCAATVLLGNAFVRALILEDSAGLGTDMNPFVLFMGTRIGRIASNALYTPTARRYIDSSQVSSELRRLHAALSSRSVRYSVSRELKQARKLQREVDASLYLEGALRVAPVYILWGEKDQVFPVGHLQQAALQFPLVVSKVIGGAGHTPHVTHPSDVANVVRAAVAGV